MRAALRQASIAAHVEAIQSFELVLRHLPDLDGDQDDLELQARSGLAASLLTSHGYTAPEVAEAYDKLRGLAIARDAQLEVSSLYGLWAYYHVTGDARKSLETAETLLERAIACNDDRASLAASAVLGYQLQRLGRPIESIGLLREGRRWHSVQPIFPHHPGIGAGANLAMTQWLLGDFAGARESAGDAVAEAEALDGPTAHFTRAYTHAFVAELFQVAGQPEVAARHAGRVVQVAGEFGFTSWLAAGMTNLKIAEALAGDLDAIPTIEYCLGAWRAAGAASNLTQFGLGLALAYRLAGRTADALTTIDQALQDAADNRGSLRRGPSCTAFAASSSSSFGPMTTRARRRSSRRSPPPPVSGSQALELSALLAIERRARSSRRRAKRARRDRSRSSPGWTRRAATPSRCWRGRGPSWRGRPRSERSIPARARDPRVGGQLAAAAPGLRRARRRDRVPAPGRRDQLADVRLRARGRAASASTTTATAASTLRPGTGAVATRSATRCC